MEIENSQISTIQKETPKKFLESNLSKMNDSVSVSAISTASTRNQIDRCKELLDEALNYRS